MGTSEEPSGRAAAEHRALAESEARYRALARNFPNGAVALFDHELRYTLVEGRGLEAIGLSKERLEGKTLWEAWAEVSPDTLATAEPAYRAALRGESTTAERSFRDRTFLVQLAPVKSESGDIIAGMFVALDITDRKRAEEEVRETHAFLDSVVENIPNMVFVKSAEELRFVRFNRAGEELLGYPRDALIGRNDYDFFPKEEADFFTSKDREVLERGAVVDIPRETVQTKAKGTRILHTKKIPISDEGGRPRYLLGISEDITDRIDAEEQLHQAKEAAEHANRAKSEFLSRMSHELRTPLNAILGFGQLLEMDSLEPENQESVQQILKGGRHLLALINEVLDIARIESGSITLSLEPIVLPDALWEAMDLIHPLAAEQGIELKAEESWPADRHVEADRQRLKQVLLNLLSNAVKYNRPAGRVTVRCLEVPGDGLRVEVSDQGAGIPPQLMDRLFVPFDRLGAEASGVEGTGLGLALSKRLMEAMGGTLGVDSAPGGGSTFFFELPLAAAPGAGEEETEAALRLPSGTPEGTHTLLYIEDNTANLRLIERALGHRPDLTLLSAMQGSMGLDLARQHLPDLVLLDLHLPDMAGEELLRTLQADPRTRQIPVIVISADATSGQVRSLLAAGARAYLTKPLDMARFFEVVDETLRERRLNPAV